MSKTPKTTGTKLRTVAGITITVLSLAITVRGEDTIAEPKSPAASFDASPLLQRSLLPRADSTLPFSPVQVALSGADVRENRDLHRWKLSLIPLAGSQALDVSSSWGMRELNPVLAGKDGRFGAQAAGVKLGVAGAFVGVQYLVVRKFPHTARFFTKINWAGAALTSGLAAHNYAIR